MLRLAVIDRADYSRPDWAWAVIVVMTVWTIVTTVAYAHPDRRTRLLLSTDLAVTAVLLLSTAVLQSPQAMRHGVTPVTATWLAGPVLAWAVRYGRRAGTVAALIMSGCDLALFRGAALSVVLNGVVLLLLAGVIVGHLARLAAEVEAERQHAVEVEAASRERERLARNIHDSVLQVLALVQRRGRKLAVWRRSSDGWRISRKPRSVPWWEAEGGQPGRRSRAGRLGDRGSARGSPVRPDGPGDRVGAGPGCPAG